MVTSSVSDHPIDYADPMVYDLWVDEVRRTTGRETFDLLFTSEPAYGDETARRLSARHVLVDPERRAVPISATAIRDDPASHWAFIPPPVRAHYVRRVYSPAPSRPVRRPGCRAGGSLSDVLGPEHGREVWVPKDQRGEPWTSTEFLEIGLRQQAREDAMAREANRLLFCDTDALATAIWHEHTSGGMGGR